MGAVLVINVTGVETRVALVENGAISEYYLERKKDKGIVGNIYKGRVVRVLPGMQAAFVDIGLDKAAFLYVNDVFYDPDFSEQHFELTEGEHADLDDDLEEGLDLGSGDAVVTKTPIPSHEVPPHLAIMALSAPLGTPGELKTPKDLNGSMTHKTAEQQLAARVSDEQQILVKEESAVEPAESPVRDVSLTDPEPRSDEAAFDRASELTTNTSDSSETLPLTTTPTPPVTSESETAPFSASGTILSLPLPADDAAEAKDASTSASTAAIDAEENDPQTDPVERRGELRARSRRRRRGSPARREFRHGEQTEQKPDETQAISDGQPADAATPDNSENPLSEVTTPAITAKSEMADEKPAEEPVEPVSGPLAETAPAPEAIETAPVSIASATLTAETTSSPDVAISNALPVSTDLQTSSEKEDGLAPDSSPESPGTEDPTPSTQLSSSESENTPVAERQQRGSNRHGRQGDRSGRRGSRPERGSAETKPSERHNNNNNNGDAEQDDSDNGKSKRRPTANIQDLLKVGQEIIVQVAKDPIGTKGARVTSHISIPGRQIVFMPTVDHVGISRRIEKESERRRLRDIVERIRPPGTGFIVRTVAENISTEKLEADARFLIGIWSEVVAKKDKVGAPALLHPDLDLTLRATRDLFVQDVEKLVIDDRAEWERISRFVTAQAPALKERIILHEGDEPIFDAYGIEHELQRAYGRKVWLKSGGYLIIDQAEALTAIDVNSGRYVGKKSLEETITKINIEAAKEIVYQLRLRNIGGIMIIDFIDMAKAQNRDKVFKALQEALGRDKARTNILKISELGLIEMTRKRVRESLGRTLNEPCSYCDGRGHLKSKSTIAYEIFREIRRHANNFKEGSIIVNCHPDIARILQSEERDELRYLMDRFNKTIQVRAQQGYHQEQFEVYGKAERQPRSRMEREQRDNERRQEREQRQGEQGSLKLSTDRGSHKKTDDIADRKPFSAPLEQPSGRLSEYPSEKEKSDNHQ